MVVPVLTLRSLLTYGERRVIQAAVLEVRLLGLLHLDNEAAAVGGRAVNVEDGTAVAIAVAKMLAVQILHIGNLGLRLTKKGIEETDEQVLVHLGAEKLLEPKVCIRVNVSLPDIYWHSVTYYRGKDTKKKRIGQRKRRKTDGNLFYFGKQLEKIRIICLNN